jgi:chromatin remodeling complex protein RSC6
MSTDFIPPSDDIKRLFSLTTPDIGFTEEGSKSERCDSGASNENEGLSKPSEPLLDDSLFSEDELSKMPSTLLKAIRRTNTLLLQTEATKKVAIEINNELKGIHSLLIRYAKKTLKSVEKTEVESNLDKGKARGFSRQCRVSNDMCGFMGLANGTMASRVEVNRAINLYIKEHQLTDNENAQKIIPDEKLWALLSESARGNKITYFSYWCWVIWCRNYRKFT